MKKDKKEALKNKIDEVLQEKLAKIRNRLVEEELEEEEEKVIEPFLMLDPDEVDLEALIEYCKEEGLELHFMDEVGELHQFEDLNDVLHPEACPSEEPYINEEEIEYIPINEVELNEEELHELNEVTKDIEAIDDLLAIPCEVNGKAEVLVDMVNCNVKPIPLLGIYLIAPINIKFVKVTLDADMQSDEEIEIEFIFKSGDQQVILKMDLHTLVNAGLISLACIDADEPLRVSPAEFRGMTLPADISEINKLF